MLKNLWRLRSLNVNALSVSVLNKRAARAFAQEAAKEPENFAALENAKKENPFTRATAQIPTQEENDDLTTEEREKRLKVLKLELDIAYQEGRRVPTVGFIKNEQWLRVLALPTKSARMKYYGYLWQVEKKRESAQHKREERAVRGLQRREEVLAERAQNNHIIYGLSHNTMFLRIYDSTINKFLNNRLVQAMQYSPKIVLDCSYDEHMNRREAENAAKQLTLCFAENRAHDDPFDLHYCNVNMQSICMRSLHKYIPTMLNMEFPMNVHEQCYTELFPKKNIVYLTPHCRTDLEEYNCDDIYVIGAMVDTVNNEPFSLAKAKRLGLRMARLPLDQYLQWGSGSGKSLTLNQVLSIMLDIKKLKNWEQALRHVPRRKVLDLNEEVLRDKALKKRADKFLMPRIDQLLRYQQEAVQRSKTPINNKHKHEFKLETWASTNKFKV